MIIIMKPDVDPAGQEIRQLLDYLGQFQDIQTRSAGIRGSSRLVNEIYLIGPTHHVPIATLERMSGVEKVVRVSSKYRQIGRHGGQLDELGFVYNGVEFSQETFNCFVGPCAVDTLDNVETMFRNMQRVGLVTARMGVYKPRTSPYDFQGHGQSCLHWLFDLAGRYGIKVIAMEVLKEIHIQEIYEELEKAGRPTGVMLQIGTRNAQNFELLKAAGSQKEFPVLYKRGMGLPLEDSLNACEYIASEGNRKIVFCLRGVQSRLGEPHRNLVDFAHVPVVKRLTRLPVCIDPPHSVGSKDRAPDGLMDIFHVSAQGIIAGANMILVEFHPRPEMALCDGHQALTMQELEHYVKDVELVRNCYRKRVNMARQALLKSLHQEKKET